MNIKTKYNVGDVVMCVASLGDGNLFSIRGLLPIARINIEISSTKGVRTIESLIKVQYGFRRKYDESGLDFYWVQEQHVFTRLEEAPAVLDSLGYSLNFEEEKKKIKNGTDFAFLSLKDDEVELKSSYAKADEDDDNPEDDEDIPF